jgi:hypothetical protein
MMNDAPLQDLQEKSPSLPIHLLFSQLNPNDIEQFTHAYYAWTLHQRVAQLSLQIDLIHQEIDANEERLHLFQPTTLALSTLAQLQAHGVSNIDLLDRLHTRGETWLDQALQLLEHCERLDLIQGDYTQWCEHALEGAYDWLSSIDEEDLTNAENGIDLAFPTSTEKAAIPDNTLANETETLLLRKLFSDTGDLPTHEKATDATIPSQAFPGEEPEVEQIHSEDTSTQAENLSENLPNEIPVSPLTLDQPELLIEAPAQEQTLTSETPEDTLDDTLAPEEVAEHEAPAQEQTLTSETPEDILDDTLAPEEVAEHEEQETPYPEDSQSSAQEEKEQDHQPAKEQLETGLAEDSTLHNTIAVSNEAAHDEDAAIPDTTAHDEDAAIPDTTAHDEALIIIANEQSNGPNTKERQEPVRPIRRHSLIRRLVGLFFPKG